MIITIDDVRALHCTRGARRWFEAHGMDFRDFLRNGVDAEVFLARGDHLAAEVVRHKAAQGLAEENTPGTQTELREGLTDV